MLSLENLRGIWRRAEEDSELLKLENPTIHALVLPLIGMLGYDYHNPREVAAELAVDSGTRVDYAIMRDGKPIILLECKALGNSLGKPEIEQLAGYFTNTDAAIGVLTNGVVYKFFSDLDETNKMDKTPFLEVDISEDNQSVVTELKRFAKGSFDPEKIKTAAKTAAIETNVISGVKANMERMYNNPDDEFSGTMLRNVVAGELTEDHLRELVKRAFNQFVSDHSGMESNGWQSLSDLQLEEGHNKPTRMMLHGDKVVNITMWNQVVVEIVRWLTDEEHLNASDHCPIQDPDDPNKFLVATQPKHRDDNDFTHPQEVNSLYVDKRHRVPGIIKTAKIIIDHVEMDASQFKLYWEPEVR